MESLRVGFFTEIYRPVVNGVVASIDALADGLRERGHQVYCFAPHMPGYVETSGSVFRIPSLPLPARTAYRLTVPLVSRRELKQIIERLSLVHVHSPFVTGWMGMRYARRYGMPLVYTYHTQLEAYAHYVPFDANATRRAASHLTRTFANHADAVIVPTTAMAARLRAIGVTTRIEVVPSGIDVRHFGSGQRDQRLRARLGAGPQDRVVLCVGRLAKEKNLELLLQAFAQTPNEALKLVVAGEGPLRGELERQAQALGIARRTHFLGVVSRDELPQLYASADAFVMPSTTETQGLVLAEALAAGAAVMAADTAANREVLGGAGQLVPARVPDFAGALARVALARGADPEARRAAAPFAIERQLDSMEALYSSLLQRVRIA